VNALEPLPHTSEPVPSTEEVEAAVVAEVESEVRLASATPAKLPVAAHVPQPVPVQPPAVRPRSGLELLVPLREAAGQLVPQLQYQIARLGIAGQAGLAAFVAAVALAIATLLPAHRALQNLNAELARALLPSTPASVQETVPRLVASLPTRAEIPAVIGQIYAQAQSAGVSIDKGRYAYVPAKGGAIGRYEAEFPVSAAYPAIRTFINGTLTAVPAASLEKLRFERKAVGEQVVNADIGFVVFVRGEAQP
jgi:hypothetical protein